MTKQKALQHSFASDFFIINSTQIAQIFNRSVFLFIMFFSFFCLPHFHTDALADQLASPAIKVVSHYTPQPGGESFTRTWTFLKEPDGYIVYDGESNDRPYSIIRIISPGNYSVSIRGTNENLSSTDGILLSSGLPCPFDQVDHLSFAEKEIKIIKIASGVSFSETYTKTCSTVNLDKAVANCWINEINRSFVDYGSSFNVFKIAEKKSGKTVLVQVWQKDSDFWIYESSENRESFRAR